MKILCMYAKSYEDSNRFKNIEENLRKQIDYELIPTIVVGNQASEEEQSNINFGEELMFYKRAMWYVENKLIINYRSEDVDYEKAENLVKKEFEYKKLLQIAIGKDTTFLYVVDNFEDIITLFNTYKNAKKYIVTLDKFNSEEQKSINKLGIRTLELKAKNGSNRNSIEIRNLMSGSC